MCYIHPLEIHLQTQKIHLRPQEIKLNPWELHLLDQHQEEETIILSTFHTQDFPCLLDGLRTLQQLLQNSFPLLVRQSSARTDTQGLHLGRDEGGDGLGEHGETAWQLWGRSMSSCEIEL